MPQYLDIGVVRIQRYLGRWPALAGRRNASAMVSGAMRPHSVGEVLDGRATANPEAGEVDGVMSLLVADGHDPAALAVEAITELRRLLPAADLEATWAQGDDYLSAYPKMRRQVRDGGGLLSLPASHGFPVLKVCDLCRADAAVTEVRRPDGRVKVCLDCGARAEQPHGSRAEQMLREATGWQMAKDFRQLAALGDDGEKGNHLALVMADGNSFGAFFTALTRSGKPREDVAKAFKVATNVALQHATNEMGDVDGVSRVLPHVVGGDDVLVSLPATYGWRFVTTYLRFFNTLIETAVKDIGSGLPVPTASAALVFAHQSWPFDRAAELADDLLRLAKRAGQGEHSTVAWQEVTRRGDDANAAFAPLRLSTIDGWHEPLQHLGREVSRSSRNRLEGMLAEGALPGELGDVARRLGVGASLYPDVEDWDLASALDISRWYR